LTYHGSCHCGRIAFEVEGEIDSVLECNCSICLRKGSLLWFVPRERMRLLTPEGSIQTYTFHEGKIQHRFCPRCGIHPFGEGSDPAGQRIAAINVRCLDGVDLATLPTHHYDGRSL
jgi:hypothetical protein